MIDPDNVSKDERAAADKSERAAPKRVRRMLKAGVSQYHPDPMAALRGASAPA